MLINRPSLTEREALQLTKGPLLSARVTLSDSAAVRAAGEWFHASLEFLAAREEAYRVWRAQSQERGHL